MKVGLDGIEVYDMLREEYDIQIEFGDWGNFLAYLSIGDRPREIERLVSALSEVRRRFGKPDAAGLMRQEYIDPEVVASPQERVSRIVAKAVNMARMMNIPILGITEHMSYLVCPDCGRHISLFGESHVEQIAAKHGLKVLAKMPIDPQLAQLADEGRIEAYGGEYLEGAADAVQKLI